MSGAIDTLKGLLVDEDLVAERAKRALVLQEELQSQQITADEYAELLTDLARIDEAAQQTLDLRRINALNEAIALLKALSSLAK